MGLATATLSCRSAKDVKTTSVCHYYEIYIPETLVLFYLSRELTSRPTSRLDLKGGGDSETSALPYHFPTMSGNHANQLYTTGGR